MAVGVANWKSLDGVGTAVAPLPFSPEPGRPSVASAGVVSAIARGGANLKLAALLLSSVAGLAGCADEDRATRSVRGGLNWKASGVAAAGFGGANWRDAAAAAAAVSVADGWLPAGPSKVAGGSNWKLLPGDGVAALSVHGGLN